jgi:short-subunit dehydrogenase
MAKTCVVVGAGPGLGLSIGRKFGQNGYRIALIARNPGRLDALVAQLVDEGIEARGFPADVSDHDSLGRALADIARDYGPIDVLEYSPEPHTPPKDLREWMPLTMSLAEIERRMNLSCYGAIVSVNQVVAGMIERGTGTILLTASGSGIEPIKTLTPVGMSMAALRNYGISLNQTVAGKGVYAAVVVLSLLIEPGDPYGDPDRLAGIYWQMHVDRRDSEFNITTPVDPHQHHLDDMKKYNVEMPDD